MVQDGNFGNGDNALRVAFTNVRAPFFVRVSESSQGGLDRSPRDYMCSVLHGQCLFAVLPLVVLSRRGNRPPPGGLPCFHKHLCHVRRHASFDVVNASFVVGTVAFDVGAITFDVVNAYFVVGAVAFDVGTITFDVATASFDVVSFSLSLQLPVSNVDMHVCVVVWVPLV